MELNPSGRPDVCVKYFSQNTTYAKRALNLIGSDEF